MTRLRLVRSSLFVLCVATSITVPAATLYVNAATGVNTGACTVLASPCKTVTYAMSQAASGSPGDEIHVAPGTYNTVLGETFPIVVKSGVHLRSTGTAWDTVLDATGANSRVLELLNANAATIVGGFTISGGRPQPSGGQAIGGGMTINGGSPTIRKNVFLNNQALGPFAIISNGGEGRGGAIHVTAATPAIVNNVFQGNSARGANGAGHSQFVYTGGAGRGGAIYFEGTGGTISNNTFYLNVAQGGGGSTNGIGQGAVGGTGESGAIYANGPSVNNNIVASNSAIGGQGGASLGQAAAAFGGMQVTNPATPISNNLFHGNTINGAPSSGDTIGTASVCTSGPPCAGVYFHGEPSNLRITPQSPAVAAGTAAGAPVDDFAGTSRPNPPAIGAFEPSPVRYANAATGVNTGACTVPASPCKTVTYAMTQALAGSPGDTIHVAPGTYNTALGETFPIVVKSGVHLKSTSGAGSTILDASGANQRVVELLNANANTIVEGFTITGGAPVGSATLTFGGGMTINGGSPTIRKNLFLNNQARGLGSIPFNSGEGRGGGMHVTAATPTIVNNVFRGNQARGGVGAFGSIVFGSGGSANGGGIYFEGTGGSLSNNTFYLNAAVGGNGGASLGAGAAGGTANFGAIYANGPSVNNNIIASNSAIAGAAGLSGVLSAAAFGGMQALNPATPITNNLLYSSTVNGAPSTGDTIGTASVCTSTPCSGVHFHGEPSNLRITSQSPAAGTGTATGAPADDFDGVARPNPPSIGAFQPSAATNPVRLVNISTRMEVLTGNDVMIGGFIIGGSTPKTVVVRARGLSLAPSGLTGLLANPTLQLFSGQTVIASNDDWQQAGNVAQIQSSGFAPPDPSESAIMTTLNPGGYTAIVSGVGATTGIGIVEVFEVDAITTQLINIATRGRVQTGDKVMIAGFIIQGTGPQSVVVRARGPSLAQFGIANPLANPKLDLYSGQTVIGSNDDWQQAANAAQLEASGFAPSVSLESAILVTLQPGAYTAIVTGVGGTTGVAIVEVFKN